MNADTFEKSLNADKCPDSISLHLQALWYDAKGNWHQAHAIVQQLRDKNAAQIHAYLHRKEGNRQNSLYWYKQVGNASPEKLSIKEEWRWLVNQSFIK